MEEQTFIQDHFFHKQPFLSNKNQRTQSTIFMGSSTDNGIDRTRNEGGVRGFLRMLIAAFISRSRASWSSYSPRKWNWNAFVINTAVQPNHAQYTYNLLNANNCFSSLRIYRL